MNLLLLAYYFRQPGSGGTARWQALAEHFGQAGHGVTVIAAGYEGDRREGAVLIVNDPSRNNDRRRLHGLQWLARRLAVEATLRCGGQASIFSAWLRRAKRAACSELEAAPPDVILATYPPAENIELGLHLRRLSGIPLVVEFRDGMLFEPVELRALRFAAVGRKYRALEIQVVEEAAAIVTVSPPLSRYFKEELGAPRVFTIPNGHDAPPAPLPLTPDPFVSAHFHVVHTGAVSLSDRACDIAPWIQGVASALAAAPALRRRLRLHFAGRLNRRERRLLRPLVAAGIARSYGLLPRETATWMQARADLLLLLTSGGRSSVATAKLFEYMGAGRPVLAMAEGTFAAEIVRETGIGWVTASGSPAEAAAALAAIMTGEAQLPARDETAIERYARKTQAADYLSLLQRVRR